MIQNDVCVLHCDKYQVLRKILSSRGLYISDILLNFIFLVIYYGLKSV